MLTALLGSVLTGGVTGLLGVAFEGILKYLSARQQHKQTLELRRLELDAMDREAAAAERVTVIQAESAEREAEHQSLQASYHEAAARWSTGESPAMVMVDVVRGLTRPVLTGGLIILCGAFYFAEGAAGAGLNPGVVTMCVELWTSQPDGLSECILANGAVPLRVQVVATVLYMTTAAVLWWFGGRGIRSLNPGRGG